MLGHRRLCEAQRCDDIVDGSFAGREELQDISPARFGYRIEGVGCRRCARHDGNHIPITEYVKRGP